MNPAVLKLAVVGVLGLLLITAGGVWKKQDWRYGRQLADQVVIHQADLAIISSAAASQQLANQDSRLVLEQRLAASDKAQH
jgi:hypothetical protein